MTHRSELERHVANLSEAEVYTVLRFVQFLEDGHIRPRIGDPREMMKHARVMVEDLVEIVDLIEHPEVELVHAPRRHAQYGSDVLIDAVEVPRTEWRVTLDGFSHIYHDLPCHLWVESESGDAFTLAYEVPLGQVYLDEKGSERDSIQVAVNRSGTTLSDFRFMHRITEPDALYLKETEDGELVDLIIESAGKLTVLEVNIPEHPAPGLRVRKSSLRKR